MAQADSHDSTNTCGLSRQQAERIQAVDKLLRLRREAQAEIERLIGFLDQSDEYVMTELEENDDRELVGDDEPSLGSFDRMTNQEKSWRTQSTWPFPRSTPSRTIAIARTPIRTSASYGRR